MFRFVLKDFQKKSRFRNREGFFFKHPQKTVTKLSLLFLSGVSPVDILCSSRLHAVAPAIALQLLLRTDTRTSFQFLIPDDTIGFYCLLFSDKYASAIHRIAYKPRGRYQILLCMPRRRLYYWQNDQYTTRPCLQFYAWKLRGRGQILFVHAQKALILLTKRPIRYITVPTIFMHRTGGWYQDTQL